MDLKMELLVKIMNDFILYTWDIHLRAEFTFNLF